MPWSEKARKRMSEIQKKRWKAHATPTSTNGVMHVTRQIVLGLKGQEFVLNQQEVDDLKTIIDAVASLPPSPPQP